MVAVQVAPCLDTLGVMLPYSPLHHLLLNQSDPLLAAEPAPAVLVMTSGNLSEEPIASDNDEALERLERLADAFLLHDRNIHIRSDDSVLRVNREYRVRRTGEGGVVRRASSPAVFLRRSRGYAPYPVHLPFETLPTLATGGELKNTFCLTRERYAFLSHHIGDMENVETYESFEQGVEHFSSLFRIQPKIVACDLHPNYFTTRYAHLRESDAELISVQHHHAHIAACMADNALENHKVIGLSFDGTGYGIDGNIWGGEFLVADYAGFERAAHLEYLPLPGADAAIRHPWRIALAYATTLGLKVDDLPFLKSIEPESVRIVRSQVEKDINTVLTSSMGRIFDAVAGLAGVRNQVTYEAQAAIELEVQSRAHLQTARAYPYEVEDDGTCMKLRVGELLSAAIQDVRRGEPAGLIGARFHKAIADASVEICCRIAQRSGQREVVLSGGVWQNEVLLNLVRDGLESRGFTVYCHRQAPTNDGGLALGQAAVANHIHQMSMTILEQASFDCVPKPVSEQKSVIPQ
jgi:hydrogenase maturation protein HypF